MMEKKIRILCTVLFFVISPSAFLQEKTEAESYAEAEQYYELGTQTFSIDKTKAVSLYWQAANLGHPLAMMKMGDCYYHGDGVPQNCSSALTWYRQAAEKGVAEAQAKIAEVESAVLQRQVAQEKREQATREQIMQRKREQLAQRKREQLAQRKREQLAQKRIIYEQALNYEIHMDRAKAFALYCQAADMGYPLAMMKMGDCYYYGRGVVQDYSRALAWYQKAAENGVTEACAKIDDVKETYLKKMQDLKMNLSLIEYYQLVQQDADNGNALAVSMLNNLSAQESNKIALAYISSEGTKDYEQAVKWFRKAADQGVDEAQYNLGLCYYAGLGVTQNYTSAVEYFRKAAEQGNVKSITYLGNCYEKGLGVKANFRKAVSYYQQAAANGYAEAQYQLGLCYVGRWGELDRIPAFKADVGTFRNEYKAVSWFREAADQGHVKAQYNLGMCYMGLGDYRSAVTWFQIAANNGDSDAQCNLGNCYLGGYGVPKSVEYAKYWYQQAAKQGNERAAALLRKF